MALSRRDFIKRTMLSAAALAAPHPLARAMLAARAAHAAPNDPILVLVQLEGGNDGLHTVIPTSGSQQATYLSKRPNLGISSGTLPLGSDGNGTALGFHANLSGLHGLYNEGKVAVINGIGYAGQSLSHFRSEDIWFGGISSTGTFQYGWFGRYLDYAHPNTLVSVAIDNSLNPLFFCQQCNALAVSTLEEFVLPDDPDGAKRQILQAMYAIEAGEPGLQGTVGEASQVLMGKMEDYAGVSLSWSSNLDAYGFRLARRLKEVASIIRHDLVNPGAATGARFFHVRIGGFDTHSNQGSRQPTLLDQVSKAVTAFWRDMESLGADSRTLVMSFSEFGRRVAENGGTNNAGTDHGEAAPLFVVGPPSPLSGGIHGVLPSLETPDLNKGNLKYHTDFRAVYATVIERWLGLSAAETASVLGGSFAALGFLS